MRTTQIIWTSLFSSIFGALTTLIVVYYFWQPQEILSISQKQSLQSSANKIAYKGQKISDGLDFVSASRGVIPSVVHIKTSDGGNEIDYNSDNDDFWERFQHPKNHHYRSFPNHSSGSGVIISGDGYIATNYHVIEDAGHVEVVLNDKRSFTAKIIGVDPSTDLALLKIEAKGLPFAQYASPNTLEIGEWVLAIGNPFDLTSTVTAGIVSAKGRNINLLKNNYAIEAFIQTDAAVNPGNSGGALINLRGELVGINTAIATQTGYYSGHSFAVPIGIVRKVMDDLQQFGEPQRALLGITILNIDADFASRRGLKSVQGVFIESVRKGGAAARAGLKSGDVIRKINENKVNSSAELQSHIAMFSPGDEISITYLRKGKKYQATTILRNKQGKIKRIPPKPKKKVEKIKMLGAEFREMTSEEKKKLSLENGVKVGNIGAGKIREAGIQEGFVITHFGEHKIKKPKDLKTILKDKKRIIAIEGLYPDGNKGYYAIGAD